MLSENNDVSTDCGDAETALQFLSPEAQEFVPQTPLPSLGKPELGSNFWNEGSSPAILSDFHATASANRRLSSPFDILSTLTDSPTTCRMHQTDPTESTACPALKKLENTVGVSNIAAKNGIVLRGEKNSKISKFNPKINSGVSKNTSNMHAAGKSTGRHCTCDCCQESSLNTDSILRYAEKQKVALKSEIEDIRGSNNAVVMELEQENQRLVETINYLWTMADFQNTNLENLGKEVINLRGIGGDEALQLQVQQLQSEVKLWQKKEYESSEKIDRLRDDKIRYEKIAERTMDEYQNQLDQLTSKIEMLGILAKLD